MANDVVMTELLSTCGLSAAGCLIDLAGPISEFDNQDTGIADVIRNSGISGHRRNLVGGKSCHSEDLSIR